jgi:ribosomal protein S12 methylthiotransferase accessory factor YcaO
MLVELPGTARFADAPTIDHDSTRTDVLDVLDRLVSVGVSAVAVSSLAPADVPYHVVKVVVAGLEGPTESFAYRPGRRALAMMADAARGSTP